MSLLYKKDIEELNKVNAENCISLFVPTHRAGEEVLNHKDVLALKTQVKQVKHKLSKKGLQDLDISKMLVPVEKLIDDSRFWSNQSDGLAIFLTDSFFRKYTLPIYFKEFNAVADSFYLKPLMPMFVGNGTFYLMTLQLETVKLYECTKYSFTEIVIDDLIPKNLQERVGYDYEEKNLQFRTQQGGKGQAIFHGQEGATGKDKKEIKAYFRAINDGLRTILSNEDSPLLIVTQEYLFSIYKEINTYQNLVKQYVKVDFDAIDIFDIHEMAWEKMAPTFDQARKDKIAHFLADQGTGKTAVEIKAILPAAFDGKIETLFCENMADIYGTYKKENGTITLSVNEDNDDSISLMNVAAIQTFLKGGDVYLLDKEDMPNPNSKINALFRY